MLSEKIQDAINSQINKELYSAYLYLSMATWFEEQDLPGCANWVFWQYKEELIHAEKFIQYVNDRGGRVLLAAIEQPPTQWDSFVAVFEEVLAHEELVTASINNVVDIAIEERDHNTNNFLQWFVAEQVEEEASASDVLRQAKMVARSHGGLFMFDREMGTRTAPAAAE